MKSLARNFRLLQRHRQAASAGRSSLRVWLRLLAFPRLSYAATVVLICFTVLGFARVETPQEEMPVPVSVQIPLLLKVLSFDRTITLTPTGQQREEISIGIIFHSRVGASARARDEAVRILRQPGIRCAGLRVRVVSLDLGADESIDVAMARERLAVYYVTPVRGSDLELIRDQARADHSITLTGMPALMSKGLAVGIGLRRVPEQQSSSTSDEDERPEIIINPSEARKQGADFTSQLLKLARIVGGQGHE